VASEPRELRSQRYVGSISGCGWPTHSSTAEAPRERAILELDREVTRAEGMAIGRVLMRELQAAFDSAVVVDASTFRGEQPVFLPPEGVALARFDGDPLPVDKYLTAAALLPPERDAPPAEEHDGKVRTGRNEFLSREAYRLRKRGQSVDQIEVVLLAMNSATCEPPLTDAEVQAIAQRKRIVAPGPVQCSLPTPEGVATKLRQFAVTQEQVNNMTDTRMIWRALIALSHLSVWSAPGNGGKTTIAKLAAAELSRDGFTVFFLQEDASAGDLPVLFEHAQTHGYLLLNSTLNGGSPQDQIDTLYELVATDTNLSNYVFFLDTLKKFVDIMKKGGAREFFQLMRALTTRGATVVLLGHTNKHLGLDGKLIFEGVGDVRNLRTGAEIIPIRRSRARREGHPSLPGAILQRRPQLASSSFSASFSTLISAGLVPGPPAKCPHSVSTTCSLALGMCLTSNSLSAGGK
jgi:hypothetical protein